MKMNNNDALKTLGINTGKETKIEDIKRAYRTACSTYHPDRNNCGLEMMKIINIAYDSLEDFIKNNKFDDSIKYNDGSEDYGKEINNALNSIINLGLNIEICGSWVWVSGNTKEHREILKNSGFKWAPKKMMWHFSPRGNKSFNKGKWEIDKIRNTYGSILVKEKSKKMIN